MTYGSILRVYGQKYMNLLYSMQGVAFLIVKETVFYPLNIEQRFVITYHV